MNDQELLALAEQLEADTAEARSLITPAGPHYLLGMYANRAAYLNFAAHFLRAATAEPIAEDGEPARPQEMTEAIEQLVLQSEDCQLGLLYRREEWPQVDELKALLHKRSWRRDRIGLLACGVLGFLAMTGLVLFGMAFDWLMDFLFAGQ